MQFHVADNEYWQSLANRRWVRDVIRVGKHALNRVHIEHFCRSFHRMRAARMLSSDALTGEWS